MLSEAQFIGEMRVLSNTLTWQCSRHGGQYDIRGDEVQIFVQRQSAPALAGSYREDTIFKEGPESGDR